MNFKRHRPTTQAMPTDTSCLYDIIWITPMGHLKLIYGVSWNPEDNCFYDSYREYAYEEIKSWLFKGVSAKK